MPLSGSKVNFIVRRAQAADGEAAGPARQGIHRPFAADSDAAAEQIFDAGAAYLRDGCGSNPSFSGLEAGFAKNLPYMRLEV